MAPGDEAPIGAELRDPQPPGVSGTRLGRGVGEAWFEGDSRLATSLRDSSTGLSPCPLGDKFDETAILDAEDMLSACCGLVVSFKESEIIRLFFTSQIRNTSRDVLTRWFLNANFDIANTCMPYLSFKDFSGPVKTYEEARERLEEPLFTYCC